MTGLTRLFRPQAIALVGVPGDVSRAGARPLRFLRKHGYAGALYLVNPGRREIAGLPAYPSLGAVPGPVDVAWIGLPAAQAAGAVRDCGRAGIPFAIVLGAGFAETGADGEAEQARLGAAAAEAGVRLIGPNTVGFVNAWDRTALTFSTVGEVAGLVPGRLVVLSQSGGLGGCLVNRAYDRAFGVGLFVSTGNEADLGLAECLDWVMDDARAGAVACLIEQVRQPERVAAAVGRAVVAGVAVVAPNLGGSAAGARAARSHTGSMVGSREAWRAWMGATGVIEARDLDELLELGGYLARAPALAGTRLGMVTSSGGVAVMLADALEPRGFSFPRLAPATEARLAALLPRYAAVGNPVDITAGLPEPTFGEVLGTLARDPGIDALVVPLTMATADGGRARAEQVIKVAGQSEKPLCVCWPGGSLVREGIRLLDEAQVPRFASVERCAAALGAAVAFRRVRARPAAAPAAPLAVAAPSRSGALPWADTRALLGAAGLPLLPEAVVASAEDALRAAAGLAYPVAVKRLGPLHKTDVGGVRLGLPDGGAVRAAVADLLCGGGGDGGCLIQPMVEGLEVLVGAVRDAALGPFVVLAPGGVHAELYHERAMRPAPLSPAEAETMLDETPALAALLAGYRGRPAADRGALVDLVVRVGALAAGLGARLAELDLNPVIVRADGGGAAVVDARIVLAEAESPRRTRGTAAGRETPGGRDRGGARSSPPDPTER